MSLLRHRAGPIAIDFGSHALRVIQFASNDRLGSLSPARAEVIGAASHVYPSRAHEAAHRQSEIVDALRTILRGQKFIGRRAISALGERELLIKNIRLPEIPEAELASAVRFEAVERIAGLDDDAEIRFIPAGPVTGGAEPQQEVIVLAAPASVVREHLELLSEAGLESSGIDAALYAIFRPFERYLRRSEDQEQANVFVDVGFSGTRIVITRGNRIVFTRSFEVGGAAFDRLVADALSLDSAKAQDLRRRVAAAQSDGDERSADVDPATIEAVEVAVRPAWEKLGKEIGLCLRYCAVTFRGERPGTATCVGGESLNAHGLEHLSEVTGLGCRVGFPLRNVTCADALPVYEDRGPMAEWTTVVGLAMKPVASAVEKVG